MGSFRDFSWPAALKRKFLILSFLFAHLSISLAATVSRDGFNRRAAAPEGCKPLSTDSDFPAPDVWAAALPGILPRKITPGGATRPDYRLTARSSADVEKAVRFAAKYNLRLTVISTGHDYLGRNDAPSGLQLDVSQLRGVKVIPSFKPTAEGAESPVPGKPVEVVAPVPDGQMAVTFGAGVPGGEINLAIKSNNVYILHAFAPTVSVAGGWGQGGGHSLIGLFRGLGVDQFLEFKVVTADGKLKVANKVSNPDLFWALRGGGTGFGIVTEATVKAHPQTPTALHLIAIGSKTASLESYLGQGTGSDGLYEATAYLGSQFPALAEKGAGGFFVPTVTGWIGGSVFQGENATEAYAKSLWDPILEKMATYPGMDKSQTNTTVFPSFQDFFNTLWPALGRQTGGSGTGDSLSLRYGPLLNVLLDFSNTTDVNLGTLLQVVMSGGENPLAGLDVTNYQAYTSNGDFNLPTPSGKFPMDTRLLGAKHLQSLPSQSADVKRQFGSRFLIEIASGGKAHRPDDDVSVHPAWRQAYINCYTPYFPPLLSADVLRTLAPDSGAYINEAYYGSAGWKNEFWGATYPRLSEIKTKYDPNMLFWQTPGINADLMEVRDGRVCKAGPGVSTVTTNLPWSEPPKSDNQNSVDLGQNLEDFLGIGVPYTGQNATTSA